MIQYLIIDLFCGAGGVTTGMENARDASGRKIAKVIACINHDPIAIESHAANHPETLHFTEDIRTMKMQPLQDHLTKMKTLYPNAKIVLWASLECTNFSNAKGGQPRDADSRTLAHDLFRYQEALNPHYILIENVREFMSWGPLNDQGKPVSRKHGQDFIRWCNEMQGRGYNFKHKLLNAADYGAHTSRIRLFIIFNKPGLNAAFPLATHARNPEKAQMFGSSLKSWKPVREVLDLSDEGESIFNRKKPLVDRTLRRILAGLKKYAVTDRQFLSKYYSDKKGKYQNTYSGINSPGPTITTKDGTYLVSTEFLTTYYGNGGFSPDSAPCPTLGTKDTAAKIRVNWLDKQYNRDNNHQSIEAPIGTLTTNNHFALVTAESSPFLMNGNGFENGCTSLDEPAPAILASRRHHYLFNPQYSSNGSSVDFPCFTLIARMDKAPPSLVTTVPGYCDTEQTITDNNPVMQEILVFMAQHDIVDIKMRMLKVPELKRITGFPNDYILMGSKTDQKKFIGNAVPCILPQRIIETINLI